MRISRTFRRSALLTAPACSLLLAACATTPTSPPPSVRMAALSSWVGTWEGTGWTMTPDRGRVEFVNTERVEVRANGDALLLEGRGVQRKPGGETIDIHNGITLVTPDAAGNYRWHGHEVGRTDGDLDATLSVTPQGASWNISRDRVTVRFTIRVEGDRWLETGAASADGRNWNQFMECEMRRVARTGP